jgi:hypothetical protein
LPVRLNPPGPQVLAQLFVHAPDLVLDALAEACDRHQLGKVDDPGAWAIGRVRAQLKSGPSRPRHGKPEVCPECDIAVGRGHAEWCSFARAKT